MIPARPQIKELENVFFIKEIRMWANVRGVRSLAFELSGCICMSPCLCLTLSLLSPPTSLLLSFPPSLSFSLLHM